MAYIESTRSNGFNGCLNKGSGFFVNANSIVTVAHNIKHGGCTRSKWKITGQYSNGTAFSDETTSSEITSVWRNQSGGALVDYVHDFAVIKLNNQNQLPLFPAIYSGELFPIFSTITDAGTGLGYPTEVNNQTFNKILFKEERSVYDDYTVLDPVYSDPMLSHFFDQTTGQSGGPLFFSHNYNVSAPVVGIFSVYDSNGINYATPIDNFSSPIIQTWAQIPPPNVIVNISAP